jgi:hypothetical protein
MLFRVVAEQQAGGMWMRRKERGSTRSDPSPRDEYYDEAFSAYMHFVLGFLFTFRGPVDQFQKTVEW